MKPLLLFCSLFLLQEVTAQSLDYFSVRKKNGASLKNFYAGSHILLQENDGSYLQGPIHAVRNDSVFVTVYDIRFWPTPYGTYVRDTVTTTFVGVNHKDIKRVALNERRSFLKRASGPLLMLGGGGYLVLNILNGALYRLPITSEKNLRKIGVAAGAFGTGFLLKKLFSSDGFSKKGHQLVYVDL